MPTHANKRARSRRAMNWTRLALAAAVPVVGAGAVASPALATAAPQGVSNYNFTTLDNQADPTFNQLLGINQHGLIAGYFGSGMAGHPNQGYLLTAPYGQANYRSENWPESTQTQVTGLNDRGVTVGFWSSTNKGSGDDNRAFVSVHGYFIDGDFPTNSPASPPVDQLLGVNDRNVAVGFYNDANGDTHAYTFDIRRNQFTEITVSGITGPTAAGINNRGDIAGFGTNGSGQVVGYLLRRDGHVTVLNVPGSSQTTVLGINDNDEVVGTYQVGSGDTATTHGFTWTPWGGFRTVDDPHTPSSAPSTTINGVNDQGDLVGFYTDAAGNVDGLLAMPNQHNHHR
jgi:hypothetical protein